VVFTDRCRTVPAEMVVMVSYGWPNRELGEHVRELDGPWSIHEIGDVTGTNGIMAAIHQAATVARAL